MNKISVILILLPVAELLLFIEIGSAVGSLVTIGLIISTALIGISLMKTAPVSVLESIRGGLLSGETPEDALATGMIKFIAGIQLLFPGLITDIMGFLFWVASFKPELITQSNLFPMFSSKKNQQETEESGRVIEGEFQTLEVSEKVQNDS
ncbi:MAG: hypothetical protein CMQ40_03290 [Gammaproteobacteria bacterium]|nr:hypothetical protein [Gammaproteobacteria bacterium]